MKKLFILMLFSTGCAMAGQPMLQPFADIEHWVVRAPIEHEVGESGRYIVVPEGFVTDFSSVPFQLRAVFPQMGQYLVAAIVHDYLYWNQSCTRRQADEIFYLAMKKAGVTFVDREAFYLAVDKVGSSSWKKNKRNKAAGAIKVIPKSQLDIPSSATWGEYSKRLALSIQLNQQTATVASEDLSDVCKAIDEIPLNAALHPSASF